MTDRTTPLSVIDDILYQLQSKTFEEEMEGRFAAAEALADNAYMVLSQIQNEVPADQQADVLAEYLRESGFSSHVVEQMLGIPRSEVDAALASAGYDVTGQPLGLGFVASAPGSPFYVPPPTGGGTGTSVVDDVINTILSPVQTAVDAVVGSDIGQAAIEAGNAAGREIGKIIDEVFRILRLPPPTKIIGNPQPGAKIVWGQTGGSPVIYTGTTPSGTQTGVTTGVPWLDAVVNRTIKVSTGQSQIPNASEIGTTVVSEAIREVLGLPADFDTEQLVDSAKDILNTASSVFKYAEEDTEGTDRFGVDLTGLGSDGEKKKVTDSADPQTDSTDPQTVTSSGEIEGYLEERGPRGGVAPRVRGGIETLGSVRGAAGDLGASGAIRGVGIEGAAGDLGASGAIRGVGIEGAAGSDIRGATRGVGIEGAAGSDVRGAVSDVGVAGAAGSDIRGATRGIGIEGAAGSDIRGGFAGSDIRGGFAGSDIRGGFAGSDIRGGFGGSDIRGGFGGSDIRSGNVETNFADGVSGMDVRGNINPYEYETVRGTVRDTSDEIRGSIRDGGDNGGGGFSLPSGFRGIKEEPGGLVDIDYLYDFAKGLDQPFVTSEEDEEDILKGLYVYQEGGEVSNQNNEVTRRPGEYGRTYFDYGTPAFPTDSGFVATGRALGGGALNPNTIQIPEYSYLRSLKPEYGGPASGITYVPPEIPPAISNAAITEDQNNNALSGSLVLGGDTVGGIDTSGADVLNQAINTSGGNQFVYDTTAIQTPLDSYLSSLGYGTQPKTITQDDVADFMQQEQFEFGDIADALGIDEQTLIDISEFESTPATATYTAAPGAGLTELQNYLLGQGFGQAKTLTPEDITAFQQSGYALADIANALGLTEADLNAVGVGADASGLTPLQNYLLDMGFGEARTLTPEDISTFQESDYTLAEIANALGLTEADLNAVGAGGQATGLTPIQSYLIGMGFGQSKPITSEDITAFLNSDYTLEEIANALGLTVADLQGAGAGGQATGLTPIQNYLIGMGFDQSKPITTDDVAAFRESDYTLAEIANALGLTEADLNAVGAGGQATGLTPLQNYLIGMGFDEPKTITSEDITAFRESDYTLADIANALGLTEADLNAVGAGGQATGLTPLQNYLLDMGFGESRPITSEDITAFRESDYTLADIANALGLTEADLNAVGAGGESTGLTPLQNYLIGMGFNTSRNITKADIAEFEKQTDYTLAQIANALGVTEADLNAVKNYTPAGVPDDQALYDFLESRGFVGTTKTVTQEDREAAEAFLEANPQYSVQDIADMLGITDFAEGGAVGMAQGQGYYLGGSTDGMADLVPATIDGTQPAALSDGEFVIPADVVSHLGNGNSDAGAEQLYSMMDRVRQERTGTTKQGPEINPTKMMPA